MLDGPGSARLVGGRTRGGLGTPRANTKLRAGPCRRVRGGGVLGRRTGADGAGRVRTRGARSGDRRRAGPRSRERTRRGAPRRNPGRHGRGDLRRPAGGERHRGCRGPRGGPRLRRPPRARPGPGQQSLSGDGRGDHRAGARDRGVSRRPLVCAPRRRVAHQLRRIGEPPGGADPRPRERLRPRQRERDVLARRERRRHPLSRRERRGARAAAGAHGARPARGGNRARLRSELYAGGESPRAAAVVPGGRGLRGAGVHPPAIGGGVPARRRAGPVPGSHRQRRGHRRAAPHRPHEQHRRRARGGGARA